MNKKSVLLIAVVIAAVVASIIGWRARPIKRVERMLTKAAATASVAVEDGDIKRRIKATKLRDYIGYELYLNVEDVAEYCDLMQDEVITAWAIVVGRTRYISINIRAVELIAAEEGTMVAHAEISVDSNYQEGRYSKTYSVVIELMTIERKLRVTSVKTRL